MATAKSIPRLHCLTIVGYFTATPPDMGRFLERCQQLAFDVLGRRSIRFSFLSGGKVTKARLPLDETGRLAELYQHADSSLEGYCTVRNAQRFRDCGFIEDLWAFAFYPDVVKHGRAIAPYTLMAFNLDRLGPERLDDWASVALDLARIFDETGVFGSGLCDIADVSETMLGRYYGPTSIGWVSFQRQLNERIWTETTHDRHEKARGVYWGNLLGPAMLKRLGAEGFLRAYETLQGGLNTDLCVRCARGSAALFLSARPSEFVFPFRSLMPDTLERGAWLYRRLAQAGLLCGG